MSAFKSCRVCKAPKRHPGCHDTCPDYQAEKAEHNRKKAELRAEQDKQEFYDVVRRRWKNPIKYNKR